jgi:hypothetical protein
LEFARRAVHHSQVFEFLAIYTHSRPIQAVTMKFSLVSILSLAGLAVSAPSEIDTRQSSLQTITDSYVFSISIGQFINNRNGKIGPAELDWDSDGCSSSPDNPFGFDCTRFTLLFDTFR